MAESRLAVVAAGGTGGHLFPAEALARTLTDRGWRVVLATDSRGAQYAQDFPAEERLSLEAATFKAGDPIGMIRAVFRIAAGVGQARAAFKRLKPAIVVGFGGYPSLPSLLAARSAGARTLIHEQNAVLGRVNRFVSGRVDAVACAFPTLEKASPKVKAKAHVVGNPVRAEVRALYDRAYEPPGETVRVLVTGGSQGARLLSEMVPDAVAMLPEALRLRLKIEQQTRMESMESARHSYAEAGVEAVIAPFFRDIAGRLRVAHLVIGRAGASTVCELAVAGLPSVLVPLAIAADDHQRFNAKLLTDVGAAEVVAEHHMTAEHLAEVLARIIGDSEGLARMAAAARSVAQPQAAERLADLVEQTAG
jgi:UDP-N-acetylglucosamine--N-acetylmuramyl-(pentapeptide) pyrophosphoryl-undecaprenol N-acetylglucosamine transferase